MIIIMISAVGTRFTSKGYARLTIGYKVDGTGNHVEVTEYAHRLVAWAASSNGYPSNLGVVMHVGGATLNEQGTLLVVRKSCKSKRCMNPYHLEFGTTSDNTTHAYNTRARKHHPTN